MTKVNHTPGPWAIDDSSIVGEFEGDSVQIALMARTSWAGSEEESAKNKRFIALRNGDTRLIAAAPELLEALKRLLDANDADFKNAPHMRIATAYETNGQAIEQARQAISKVTGE